MTLAISPTREVSPLTSRSDFSLAGHNLFHGTFKEFKSKGGTLHESVDLLNGPEEKQISLLHPKCIVVAAKSQEFMDQKRLLAESLRLKDVHVIGDTITSFDDLKKGEEFQRALREGITIFTIGERQSYYMVKLLETAGLEVNFHEITLIPLIQVSGVFTADQQQDFRAAIERLIQVERQEK